MKRYKYKGHTIVLIESPDGTEKYYTVWEGSVKINDNRDLRTLEQAKQYVKGLI